MAFYKTYFNKLEKHIAFQIHKANLKGSKLLLAVSGGKDSMTLLHSMHQIAPDFQLHLYVGHFHHGREDQESKTLSGFRDQALKCVQKKCKDYGNSLYFEIHQGKPLKSENDFRKARWFFLKKICEEKNCKAIVTAHHRDDLLETRLLRLIRGVGKQGLQSMKVFNGQIFRPLLSLSQKDLLQYYANLDYIEDPTNQSHHSLRNWIRYQWLPNLEKKSSGAVQALSRSLDLLSQKTSQASDSIIENCIDNQGIKRSLLARLSIDHKYQVIANYLCERQLHNYTASHIFEIQKRLQTPQKKIEFYLLKHKWIVNPTHIKVVVDVL